MLEAFLGTLLLFFFIWWFAKLETKKSLIIRVAVSGVFALFGIIGMFATISDGAICLASLPFILFGAIRGGLDIKKIVRGHVDPPLTIKITKEQGCYDKEQDELTQDIKAPTELRKNGFYAYDENDRCIGIVFEHNTQCGIHNGAAELMIFKKFHEEFGDWRMIKQAGKYLPYETLQTELSTKETFTCTTDLRIR